MLLIPGRGRLRMSKIVFWSPLHGQGQTSNLHIMALIMNFLYKKRVLLMQTHIAMNNLEGPLVGKNVDLKGSKDSDIFQDIGIDAAVMYSRLNKLKRDTFESCCLTFPNTSLLLLPGTEIKNREIFEHDICKNIAGMIRNAEKYVDVVMIDTNSGNDDLSFRLMPSADLIVINLTQRKYVLDRFFQEYEKRFNDFAGKIFFLFGNYDKDSCYNISNCRRKYRKYINEKNSGVIPYSTEYLDAQNESNIINMVREGLKTGKYGEAGNLKSLFGRKLGAGRYIDEETDYFLSQSCHSTAKVMRMLDMINNRTLMKRSGA